MEPGAWAWGTFAGLIALALFIDLGMLNRGAREVSARSAAAWCALWAALALLFGAWIHWRLGRPKALEYLAGYLIEYALSVDNLFVFIVVFDYFAVPRRSQARVLHWGILGAMAMRLAFVLAGVELLKAFHWTLYVFSAVLLFTGARLFFEKDVKLKPQENPALRLLRRFLPLAEGRDHDAFFLRERGRLLATSLLAALAVIEATDLVFTFDSIPAVFAVTRDPFIVYSSNVFAVLGLRSLFFVLSGALGLFRHLKTGLSVILCGVGLKMLLSDIVAVPTGASLAFIAGVLAVSAAASVLIEEKAAR